MKKLYMLLAAVLLMVITGCGGGGGGSTPTVSSAKAITAFNIVSPVAATGVITESTHTIAITVPYNTTSVTQLVATFTTTGTSVTVGSTPQISGTTPNDFTNPVVYTVTGVDASTQNYTVTVTVSPLSSSLDTTFGTSGMVTTPIGSGNAVAHALGIQSFDSRIVVAGSSNNSSNDDFTIVRYNTDGSLDTTLNATGTKPGIVTTSIGSGDAVANALGIQSDKKILVAGYSLLSGTENVFTLVRYNTDGSLDTTFNATGTKPGTVTTSIGSVGDYALALGIQSDGKIVVAGYSYNGTKYDFALVRYNTNGSLDAGFGIGGTVTTSIGGSINDYANALGIQSDGKIVVAGYSYNGTKYNITLVGYNTDGSLDTTFNATGTEPGIVTTSIGSIDDEAHALAIQSDGKIVVAGSSYDNTSSKYDFALVRYNTDGSLDTTFNATGTKPGTVTTPVGSDGYWDYAYALGIQYDKKILAAGSSNSGSNYDFALVRYNTDGSLDTTFNATGTKPGTVTTPIGSSDDFALALGIQLDHNIVVAGYSLIDSNDDFSLVRYLP